MEILYGAALLGQQPQGASQSNYEIINYGGIRLLKSHDGPGNVMIRT